MNDAPASASPAPEGADPRIVFAGTPDFAVPSLEALVAAGYRPVAVYTQPDRPAGRGRRLTPPPVKQAAEAHDLPVRQPPRIRDAVDELRALAPDLLVVVAYGQLLTQAVLDVPALDTLNVHASLLPRWRGAAPIQRALEAGDAVTGVAIMRVVLELDAGPVFAVRETPIEATDTAATLHERLARLGAEALVASLPGIIAGTLPAKAQDPTAVTRAERLAKAEARIDWRQPAVVIDRRIRAFNPWPVCQTTCDGAVLRVWFSTLGPPEAAAAAPAGARPGTVLSAHAQGVDVLTGDGVLRLLALQAAGRRRLPAGEFLKAMPLAGRCLE